jgi:hypothetical protein
MQNIHSLFDNIRNTSSTNEKIKILKGFDSNIDLIKEILEKTYDKVKWTYSLSTKSINKALSIKPDFSSQHILFSDALKSLEKFSSRQLTGNSAISFLSTLFHSLEDHDKKLLINILDRDLKINMGRTQINKVFKNLITKPPYMRCGLFTEKTSSKIIMTKENPAILQLKADGSYLAVTVDSGNVSFQSRSGEYKDFPILESYFKSLSDGVYIGELLVSSDVIPTSSTDNLDFFKKPLNEIVLDRALGNGELNKLLVDRNDKKIFIQLWDKISLIEYKDSKHQDKTIVREKYIDRFNSLINTNINSPYIKIIDTHFIDNINVAKKITSDWMQDGLEGSILKCSSGIFKDHTSPKQLKLKVIVDAEVRVIGFVEGKKGTKREKTFGAILFETDDKKIKGSVSGFTDSQLTEINSNRNDFLNKIITVEFNDLTKGQKNSHYAFSHPRFIEFRNDKDFTDSLERVLESVNMAKGLTNTQINDIDFK